MSYCPNCGKPRYQSTAFTVMQTSTVWPYCQCTYTLVTTTGTVSIGFIPLSGEIETPGYSGKYDTSTDVPKAFQDAFSEGELEL
jgi:hypothetical protein